MSIWTDEGRKKYGDLALNKLREEAATRRMNFTKRATKNELLEMLAIDDHNRSSSPKAPRTPRYRATLTLGDGGQLSEGEVQKIQEVAYLLYTIEFEAEDEYELAITVKELEDELRSMTGRYLEIPRPKPVE